MILRRSEEFKKTCGISRYRRCALIYQLDNATYYALSKVRYRSDAEVKLEDLYDVVMIEVPHYRPKFPSHFTQASNPLLAGWHIKEPTLVRFDPSEPRWIGERVLFEARANEVLMTHPHRNIAKYHGCRVQDGLITGICYDKYHESLMQRVNPDSHGKGRLHLNKTKPLNVNLMLESVRNGLAHLHSLGFAHNNINPSNIMFFNKDSDEAVIIGLGSCRAIGSTLNDYLVRMEGWYDKKADTSLPSNDLDALDEIAEWLSDKREKNFKFAE